MSTDRRRDRGDHGEGVPVGVVDQRLLFEQRVDDGVQRFFLLHRVASVGRRNLRPAGDDSPTRGLDTLESAADPAKRQPRMPMPMSDVQARPSRTDFLPHHRDSRRQSDSRPTATRSTTPSSRSATRLVVAARRRATRSSAGDDQLDRRASRDPRLGQAGQRRRARRRHTTDNGLVSVSTRRRQHRRCRRSPPAAQHQPHRPRRFQPDHGDAAAGRHRAAGLRLRQRPGVHGDRPPPRRLPRLRHAAAARRAVVPADVRLAGDAAVGVRTRAGGRWTECRGRDRRRRRASTTSVPTPCS